jgi:hypothetical protein
VTALFCWCPILKLFGISTAAPCPCTVETDSGSDNV